MIYGLLTPSLTVELVFCGLFEPFIVSFNFFPLHGAGSTGSLIRLQLKMRYLTMLLEGWLISKFSMHQPHPSYMHVYSNVAIVGTYLH